MVRVETMSPERMVYWWHRGFARETADLRAQAH
jgi:hypothetical protein